MLKAGSWYYKIVMGYYLYPLRDRLPLVQAPTLVSTRRRDKPGIGEVHTLDTDIVYVVEGTATFVTGGTIVSPKATAPDEIRGSAIEGGETYHLSKGDVIIVPNRVPHWFKEVPGPFLYFMVKVR